jgi:hypothetical protein
MVAGMIGVTAIGAVGDGIVSSSSTPLSAEEVDQQLAAQGSVGETSTTVPTTPPAPATSTPTNPPPPATTRPPGGTADPPPAEPPPQSQDRVITTQGGTVITRCRGSSPLIVSATPAQTFQVEKDPDGGEGRARVEFESDSKDIRVRVEIFCVSGEPTWTIGD